MSDFDSAVWSLTWRCDAHCRAWLRSGKHTTELDSAVGSTPRSQTDSKMSVFLCFRTCYVFWLRFFEKVKKVPWTICDLQYQFHINISRHHRGIASHRRAWLRGGKHTAESDSTVGCTQLRSGKYTADLDSAVGCTPGSSTPRWEAKRGVRLIRKCPFFVFSNLLRFLSSFFEKLMK